VRSSNREFEISGEDSEDGFPGDDARIAVGRERISRQVLTTSNTRAEDLGIVILDFQFKRINYVEQVRKEVYNRMISERQRIAEQFRSEGEGEAARIAGDQDRQLREISSEAYRQAQEIKGRADAEAARIYAAAYNKDAELYRFLRSMETLKVAMDPETVLMLGTDGELLRYLGDTR